MQVHPSQIEPAQPFDIFYFLRNHTDSATYYVRAVVYDIKTGEVLKTVTLDQSPTNARVFSKTIDAPPDATGYGRNIVAVATVYTDSGYTAKSQDYEEQEQYFLIKAATPFFGGGGIDYRVVEEILEKGITKALQSNRPKDPVPVPYETLYGAIGSLQREVNRVPKSTPDLSSIEKQIVKLQSAIAAIPKPETVNLAPVLSAIESLSGTIKEIDRSIKLSGAAMLSQHRDLIGKLSTDVLARVETGIRDMMGKQEMTIPLDALFRERKEPEAQTTREITHLY